MSRRFGTENILIANDPVISSPGGSLLSPSPDTIYSPRKIVLAASGAGSTVELLCDTTLLTAYVPGGDTIDVELPEGINCTKGSGISVTVNGGNIAATLYYVPYDESAGITKVESRAVSLSKQNALDASGRKGIRTPNEANLGDKT